YNWPAGWLDHSAPTPGVTGEYTPAVKARAGVLQGSSPRSSVTEAAGKPNPGILAPAHAVAAAPSYPAAGFPYRSSTHASDHHAPDAGSRRPLRPPDPLLEPEDEPVHLRCAR